MENHFQLILYMFIFEALVFSTARAWKLFTNTAFGISEFKEIGYTNNSLDAYHSPDDVQRNRKVQNEVNITSNFIFRTFMILVAVTVVSIIYVAVTYDSISETNVSNIGEVLAYLAYGTPEPDVNLKF